MQLETHFTHMSWTQAREQLRSSLDASSGIACGWTGCPSVPLHAVAQTPAFPSGNMLLRCDLEQQFGIADLLAGG